MTNLPKEASYPASYSAKQISTFLHKLDPNSCSTLVGPSGFGKSNFLRFLSYNRQYTDFHKFSSEIEFIYIDLSMLFDVKPTEFLLVLALGIIDFLTSEKLFSKFKLQEIKSDLATSTNLHLSLHIFDNLLNNLPDEFKFHLILDNVEKIFNLESTETLDLIRFLRDKFGNKIQFIFAINNLNLLKEVQERKFGRICDIVLHNIHFLGLETSTKSFFLNLSKKITSEKLTRILKFSGGLPSYVKQLTLSENELIVDKKLKQLTDNTSIKLAICLTPSQIKFLQSLLKNPTPARALDTELSQLQFLDLISEKDGHFEIFSTIFAEFLVTYMPQHKPTEGDFTVLETPILQNDFFQTLTKQESSLMMLLVSNVGNLVSKDEVIESVWGSTSLDGYSNWALDQLILRLRKKIEKVKPEYKIITKRGRGYILSI